MTTYRLLNNIFEYHEAFIEFKQFRRQFDGVKVWFNQKNESLIDKLQSDWIPVDIQFSSDRKNNNIPDISIWNLSCLVLSAKAKKVLAPELKNIGEFLPLQNGFYIYNCLSAVDASAIDQTRSRFESNHSDSAHIPKELHLLSEKISDKFLFKPAFAHHSFLICSDEFKKRVELHNLSGILFEPDLAQIFPSR